MEEYKDLEMTMAVFTKILDQPEFEQLEAGIVLQAYLPDALRAMIRLQEWAAAPPFPRRRRHQGAGGQGRQPAHGAGGSVAARLAAGHLGNQADSDTNYKRVINYALQPERIGNVRIGVAGHNLFDVAFAWLLAKQRGVEAGIDFEMLLGMAQGQAERSKRTSVRCCSTHRWSIRPNSTWRSPT